MKNVRDLNSLSKKIVVALAAVTTLGSPIALAAGLSISGDVPLINSLDLAWSNTHFGLNAGSGGAATQYVALAALKVYSNDPNGFTISAAGTAAGLLTGTTTAATVAYLVSLATTQANAESGTLFAAPGGAGKVDSTYISPIIAGNIIMNSGVLTTPYDTGANALYVTASFSQAATTNLMADTYTDTLTITMTGL